MLRFALVIGLPGAVGPFAIDMYLPALPTVAAELQASPQAVQATLTACFLAFGVSQLVYGPLSDRMGRRPPLVIGLAIFLAGTLGCALAPDIASLIAARFLHGVGVAGFAATTATLVALTAAGFASLGVVVGMLLLANAFMGLVMPTTMVMALDPHPDVAGLASSLGGTLQMLAGGLMITLAGKFFDGTPLPMVTAIALCGLLSLAAALATLRGRPLGARPAAL